MLVAMMCALFTGQAWAQSDFSDAFTGNVTLSTNDGTSTSACKVVISNTQYDGIKAGTGKIAGAVQVTVPSGTKYLHLHAAAWNGENVTLGVTPSGYSEDIALTANSGISNNSPFTFSGDATSDDFYKVITFDSALEDNTTLTFTATSGKRFVIWGVTAEEDGGDTPTPTLQESDFTLTGTTDLTFDLYDNSEAQVINYRTSSTGAVTVADNAYVSTVVGNNTITVTPLKKTNGEVEITVNQAKDENYKAGSATFKVTITDSTPVGDISEETINISDFGLAQGDDLTTYEGKAVTLTWSKGSNSNAPKAYEKGSEARFYKGNTLTFTATKAIAQIEFTYSNGYNGNNFTASTGTMDDGVWTGEATEVTLTNGASDNTQIRFTSITITYAGDDGRADAGLSFSSSEVSVAIGEQPQLPTLNTANGFNGTVEYTSSDETVAVVADSETGELRIVGGGTTTIKATFEGDDDFKPGSASYTLTVTDNRTETRISYGPIELDIADVATLTQLAPVVTAANGNIIEYTNEGFPPTVSFEVVSDKSGLIASLNWNSGEILLHNVLGTATIKAYYNFYNVSATYKPSECTFTITVFDKNAKGTKNNPYSVDEARAAIDAGTGLTGVYATGIVSEIVTAYNSQFGNISYNISEDGSTESEQLQAYRGFDKDGDWFTSEDDVQVGDVVVIYGDLTKYNSTYEFKQGNQRVSYQRTEKQDAGLSFGQIREVTTTLLEQFNAPTLTNPNNLTNLVWASTDTDVATVDPETGEVTVLGVGQTEISVTFSGDDSYKAGSAKYLLKVESGKEANDLAITAPQSTTLHVGDVIQLAYTTSADGDLTWSSSNGEVLTVEDGVVSAVGVGTATITLTQAASNTYDGGEASVEFTVKKAVVVYDGNAYVKVTSEQELEDGAYLIVYEDGNVAFDGSLETLDAAKNTIAVEIIDGVIAKTQENQGAYFVWDSQTGTLQSASGYYIGKTANSNGIDADESTEYTNAITFGNEGEAVITASGECTLRFNKASGQERFRYYKTGQEAIALYKLTTTTLKTSVKLNFGQTEFTVEPNADFTAPRLSVTDTEGGSVEGLLISYASDNEEVAVVNEETGAVQIGDKEGVATITATFAGNNDYNKASASYTITVKAKELLEPEIAFEQTFYTVNIGATFTAPVLTNPNQLNVTYASDNDAVATVDENTGALQLVTSAEATVTITATFAGNNDYKAGSASYTIDIVDPNAGPTYYALVGEYDGKFYAVNAKGGSTWGATEVDAVNGKVLNGTDDLAWELVKNGNGQGLRNKTKTSGGDLIYIGYATSGTNLKTSPALVNWTIDKENKTWTNMNGNTSGTVRSIIYSDSQKGFKNYAVSNANQSGYGSFTTAYTFAEGYTREVTAGNWGTICLPNDVSAEDYAGAKFYMILGKSNSYLVLTEAADLRAGVAYFFQADEESSKLIAAYGEDSAVEPISAEQNNGLGGSFTGTEVAEGKYLLSGGQIVKCGTGCSIAANRAYIDMDAVPEYDGDMNNVKVFRIGGEDGINGISAEQQGAAIYDLSGRRLNKAQKGLYIVNGKKVAVK